MLTFIIWLLTRKGTFFRVSTIGGKTYELSLREYIPLAPWVAQMEARMAEISQSPGLADSSLSNNAR